LVSFTLSEYDPAIAVKVRFSRFQSSMRQGAARLSFWLFAELASISRTRRSGWGYGSGFSNTVFTTENNDAPAPTPRVSNDTDISRNPGRRERERNANFHSVMQIWTPAQGIRWQTSTMAGMGLRR